MKNYDVTTFSNWTELSETVTADLSENIAFPVSATHKTLGSCTIEDIRVSFTDSGTDCLSNLKFESGITKGYSLKILFKLDHLSLDESVSELIQNYITLVNDLYNQKVVLVREEARQKMEAELQAKVEAKKAAAYEKKKAKDIQDFEAMLANKTPITVTDEFYYSLGWIARHAGTVSAALPDYLHKYFAREFGSEAPCRVVNSQHRGPAGYQSQWTKSFSVSLVKIDTIPAYLEQYLNPKRTAISDSDFVKTLVQDYGLKFGKQQDIEAIRDIIPVEYISIFESGYGPDSEPKAKKTGAKKKLQSVA